MSKKEQIVEVILDVFSGVPNPKWRLQLDQIEELKKKSQKLLSVKAKPQPGLGYRGFIINNISKIPEIPGQMKIFDGVLTTIEKGVTSHVEDTNKIEDWLFEIAIQKGYGDIVKQLRIHEPK